MPGWSQLPELTPHHHAAGAAGVHERPPVIAPPPEQRTDDQAGRGAGRCIGLDVRSGGGLGEETGD
jgi:hypothetical protein